ncbi:DUF418 domain-containing protein [Nocardia sp. CNY236]|uniref:DUF418 domain-containing protein n=1 Tax=Nocardia sp. CNY236 TaxID=1169152 RepID=UPI000408320C|nr:DUF418 domain-containing protein [Nocardia sp. CNY236]
MHSDAGELRIDEWDVARGFALCGILAVDSWRITGLATTDEWGVILPARHVLAVVFEGRFLPIFSFLFGLGFAVLLDRAVERSGRPRLVLARYLIALGVLGVVVQQVQPRAILLPHALVGLLMLLPAVTLPGWMVAVAGVVGTAGVASTFGGELALVPGVCLLGMASARFGLANVLRAGRWRIGGVFLVALPAAVVASTWESRTANLELWSGPTTAVAATLGALAYSTGLLLLLRSEPGQVLAEVLRPLGRMTVTNYVGGTVTIVLIAPHLKLSGSSDYATPLGLAVGVVLGLVLVSALWLRVFAYGPLEWAWRCLTWWTVGAFWRSRKPEYRSS